MPRNKRLHFKDIHALKGLIFFPIYFFCILSLVATGENELLAQATAILGYIVHNCVDFLFFLTAFLVTSHALREYKYTNAFSLRKFLVRRMLRLIIVLIVALVFAFLVFPWLEQVLELEPKATLRSDGYFLLIPNFKIDPNHLVQPLFMVVLASVFMFIQFYIVWGIVLKFLRKQLTIVALLLLIIGILVRILYVTWDASYLLNTFAYGVPLGMGVFTALFFRSDLPLFEKLKDVSKQKNTLIYLVGIVIMLIGYLAVDNTWMTAFLPLVTSVFFGYVILEQTFGRKSLFQLKNNKILSYLGKISYGLIIYQSIVGVLIMIAVGSLVFDLVSVTSVLIIVITGLVGTIIMADISHKLFEKPLMRVRREFKKV